MTIGCRRPTCPSTSSSATTWAIRFSRNGYALAPTEPFTAVASRQARTGYYYLEASRLDENDVQQYMSGTASGSHRTPGSKSLSSRFGRGLGATRYRFTLTRYFSGGPSPAPVNWYQSANYYFNWSDQDQDRYYSFQPFDPDQAEYDPYSGSFTLGLIREGTGVTDANGEFTIELPADISRSLQSQNWTFDVTIQSPSSQFVSGRTSVPVHRAEYYIGLSPRTYLTSAGEPTEVDLIAVTTDETPYPGAVIDAVVYEFNWNSVYELAADGSYRWSTSVERTPVYSTTLTTDRQGGDHRLDSALGRTIPDHRPRRRRRRQPTSNGAFVWVSAVADDEFVAWPRNNDRIELVADKQSIRLANRHRSSSPAVQRAGPSACHHRTAAFSMPKSSPLPATVRRWRFPSSAGTSQHLRWRCTDEGR